MPLRRREVAAWGRVDGGCWDVGHEASARDARWRCVGRGRVPSTLEVEGVLFLSDEKLEAFAELCGAHGVERLDPFGSAATGAC